MRLPQTEVTTLDAFFAQFREGIVGVHHRFAGPCGEQRILYADWTASGRLYAPIERCLLEDFGPLVGNTHSESSTTGIAMTRAYQHAQSILKQHVHAAPDDVIITQGSGMTAVVNKLQRMLGLRLPEQLAPFCRLPPELRPVVFLTHMEHHSNHTSWLETVADVEVIPPDELGLVDEDGGGFGRRGHHGGEPSSESASRQRGRRRRASCQCTSHTSSPLSRSR